ncbi:TonB-dependent receptor [Pseudozobellia thermophila]|uniref:Iron complex outermembrane recepter protein n=1 Tax=Pseudozobellia thermophila TaxID=192903 RepID=A0A1M6G520_9FLAO|nr:TonB-dependent receptor [Pseudozobellia thermophila]SHJ05024.1 iron complex outermembrane recepter protein [Pseudozobellia thermophila]
MDFKYLLVSLLFSIGQFSMAQNFTGTVWDSQNNRPLPEAHVIPRHGKATYTDANGNFQLSVPKEGTTLTISYMGYKPIEQWVSPTDTPARFLMQEAPIEVGAVMVTGNAHTDPVFAEATNDYVKKIVQPRNVADLFDDLNGFSLIKRGNYAIDPSFRASQYEQLNVQFDGGTKAMHACPNRMDPITTHVIPEEIEKIEIIKGPYTVRYGATFGGIVNLVTQKPGADDYGLGGSVQGGYESNGNSWVTMARLQQATEQYDIAGNFGLRDFGNYEDGDGVEIPSSFRSLDYGLRLGYNFTENQRLQAHWRQSYGRDVLHAGLPMDTEKDNSSVFSLDYTLNGRNGLIKALDAKAYYSYVDHLMTNAQRPTFMMVDAVSAVDAVTAGGKVELELKPTENLNLFTGVDLLHIARDGQRTRLVKRNAMGPLATPMEFTDKVWQDSYIDDYGVFVEGNYPINPKTLVTAGLRYDGVVSETQDPEADFAALYTDLDRRTEHNISGTASIKYAPSSRFLMEVAYGRGVRSANMIERFINHLSVGQDPYEYVGNPNLDAEVNNQFEVGFKGKIPLEGKGLDQFNYGSSFYYSFYENYIVALIDPSQNRKFMPMQEPTSVKVFRNLNDAYKTGVEVNAGVDFLNDFNFTTELSYVYAKNKDLGESLPLVPPLTTRFKLGFEKEKFWANATYTLTSKQDHIASSFGETETEGYDILDIRLGFVPIKNLTLGLAALNLFDKTYHNHLNFAFNNQADFDSVPINDPGRNLSAFVQYNF